jgi:2Fe-2S ferredoxin
MAGTLVVIFHPAHLACPAERGDTLMDVALAAGLDLPHSCGGNCFCTTCHVRVLAGAEHLSPMEPPEQYRLEESPNRTPQSRLACQAIVLGGPVHVALGEDGPNGDPPGAEDESARF